MTPRDRGPTLPLLLREASYMILRLSLLLQPGPCYVDLGHVPRDGEYEYPPRTIWQLSRERFLHDARHDDAMTGGNVDTSAYFPKTYPPTNTFSATLTARLWMTRAYATVAIRAVRACSSYRRWCSEGVRVVATPRLRIGRSVWCGISSLREVLWDRRQAP